jgi:hypothetical protein
MTCRHPKTFSLSALFLVAFLWSSSADAQRAIKKVQSPNKGKVTAAQIAAVKKARTQRYTPTQVKLGATLSKSILGGTSITGPTMRQKLSISSLASRLTVFQNVAKSKGLGVQTFSRTLKGLSKNGKTSKAVEAKKTFFEVLPKTAALFRESMGENVIWFASSAAPYHLHTLVADQNGGKNLTHNTYGATMDKASITRTQYMAPAHLDKAQMARFTEYLNAGVKAGYSGRKSVYGFKNSKGKMIYETECTNWATSAPIGDLPKWVQKVDSSVKSSAASGKLGREFGDGLHAALAKAKNPTARKTLLTKALKAQGMTTATKNAVKKLAKEFDTILKQFPNRPAGLVARESLSKIMGVSRSQDPAKWMYDLILSKNAPVIGVISRAKDPNFKTMDFDLGIMGTFNAKGEVIKGSGRGLGVIPTP